MAIPFITYDELNGYEIAPEAIDVLTKLKCPLAVFSFWGKYRTGKSFLTNKLFHIRAFQTGKTVNACTRGIWMYPEPVEFINDDNQVTQCIILDAEGLASTENAKNDKNICVLMLLLCSFLVYNSFTNIDESALSQISLMTNITRELKVADNKTFPVFVWLIRDFSLSLEDPNGNPITEQQYLENVLKPLSQQDECTNSIRETIRECFPKRFCVTMSRPCEDEADLRRLNELPEHKIRNVFLKEVERFKQLLNNNVKTKIVDGCEVSGLMLLKLAESYVQAINSGALPKLDDSYKMLSDIKDSETANISFDLFMQNVSTLQTLSQRQLQEQLVTWRKQALQYFLQTCKSKRSEHFTRLEKSLQQQVDQLLSSNASKLKYVIQSQLQNLQWDSLTMKTIIGKWQAACNDVREILGLDDMYLWYNEALPGFMNRLSVILEECESYEHYRVDAEQLQKENTDLSVQCTSLKTQLDDEDRKYKECKEEYSLLQSLYDDCKTNLQSSLLYKLQLDECNHVLTQKQDELQNLQSQMQIQTQQFASFCETTSQKVQECKSNEKELKTKLSQCANKVKSMEEELVNCELKYKELQELKTKLEMDYTNSQHQFHESQTQLKQCKAAHEQALKQTQILELNVKQSNLETQAWKKRVQEYEEETKQWKRLKQDNTILESENNSQKKFLEFLEKDKQSKDEENRRLNTTILDLRNRINELQNLRQMDQVRFG